AVRAARCARGDRRGTRPGACGRAAAAAPARRTLGGLMAGRRRGSVLVLLADRNDRRMLFDLLDARGFDAIHTAGTPARARRLLERAGRVDLVFAEHAGQGEAAALCAELAAAPQCENLRVIGIAPRGAARPAPADPHEASVPAWIATPIDAREVSAVLDGLAAASADPAPSGAAPGDDFRFAFDGGTD